MKRLIIVGARGWGREVYAAAKRSPAFKRGEYDIKGFLDSDHSLLEGYVGEYPPILGAPETYEIQPEDVFFIAMGDSGWRKHYAELISSRGGKFQTIISSDAYVNPNAIIEEGSFVSGWTTISDQVHIGKHVVVHVFCDIGHDAKIGDYSSIESYSFMGGMSEVGQESVLHVRSTLIRHKRIGDRVEVGAGSVVIRNVKDGQHVFGNPAVQLKY